MYNYNQVEQRVADKLIELGFHISNKGFNSIVLGIIEIHKNDISISKIYECIAHKLNSTYSRIERTIRHEITDYYNTTSNIPHLLKCDYCSGKLTNKEFLYRLAYMLRDILKGDIDKS